MSTKQQPIVMKDQSSLDVSGGGNVAINQAEMEARSNVDGHDIYPLSVTTQHLYAQDGTIYGAFRAGTIFVGSGGVIISSDADGATPSTGLIISSSKLVLSNSGVDTVTLDGTDGSFTLQSAASGSRVELTSANGLIVYDSGGAAKSFVDTGGFTVRNANAGSPDVTEKISFQDTGGTEDAFIYYDHTGNDLHLQARPGGGSDYGYISIAEDQIVVSTGNGTGTVVLSSAIAVDITAGTAEIELTAATYVFLDAGSYVRIDADTYLDVNTTTYIDIDATTSVDIDAATTATLTGADSLVLTGDDAVITLDQYVTIDAKTGQYIALEVNSTEIARIDASGISCDQHTHVVATETSAHSMTHNAWTKLIYNNEVRDELGEYNPTTGVFTATHAGTYRVSAAAVSASAAWTAGEVWLVGLSINSAVPTYYGFRWVWQATITNLAPSHVSVPVELSANDTLEIQAFHNQGAAINTYGSGVYNWFTITREIDDN